MYTENEEVVSGLECHRVGVTLDLAGVAIADIVSDDVSRTSRSAVPNGGQRYALPYLKKAFKLGP